MKHPSFHDYPHLDRQSFLLQRVQPSLSGLMDGSLSTLAPIFAVVLATHRPLTAFYTGPLRAGRPTHERSTMSTTVKKGKRQSESTNKKEGFTAEEKAAMKARARELKDKADGESAVRASIAAMSPQDRAIAKRLHDLIKAAAPDLSPKTWYGMPAYAKDGKVVCFFRNAGKFKERYAMLGFNDSAKLDEGSMWPVAFALTKLTAADEAKIRVLVKKAVG